MEWWGGIAAKKKTKKDSPAKTQRHKGLEGDLQKNAQFY
jgi:hypothetical protein